MSSPSPTFAMRLLLTTSRLPDPSRHHETHDVWPTGGNASDLPPGDARRVDAVAGLDDRLSEMFPVRSVIEEGNGVRVNVEVSSVWQSRCVVGHIGPDKVATTNIFRKGCGG